MCHAMIDLTVYLQVFELNNSKHDWSVSSMAIRTVHAHIVDVSFTLSYVEVSYS